MNEFTAFVPFRIFACSLGNSIGASGVRAQYMHEVDQARCSHGCLRGADAPRLWVACVPCPTTAPVPPHEVRLTKVLPDRVCPSLVTVG